MLATAARDLRHAVRGLRTRPGFALVAILTLALGIGATSAIFGVINAVLLEPLPYPAPDRLVKLTGTSQKQTRLSNLSVPDLGDIETSARTLEAVGGMSSVGSLTLTSGGEPERIRALRVTAGYFRVLGVHAAIGRTFAAEEDHPSPPRVVVLGHGLWQRRFGGNPDIVGKAISLNDLTWTVLGVLDRNFQHVEPHQAEPDVFYLLDRDPSVSGRGGHYIRGIGRLRPGVTITQAQAELTAIAARLAETYPDDNYGRGMHVEPLDHAIVGGSRKALLVLMGAVGCVLLIACVNLANLLLGAGAGRQKEMAVRTALGADRRRLVTQLVIESGLIALLGGACGLGLAWAAMRVLPALGAGDIPRIDGATVDWHVLAFTAAVSLAAGVLFGVTPALQVSKPEVQASLRDSSRGHSGGPARARWRTGLMTAEVALSSALLVGAGLFVRSLANLTATDPGFAHPAGVLTLHLALPVARYPEGSQIPFYQTLASRIAALPGVDAVGAVNILPFSGNYSCDGIQIETHPMPEGQNPCAEARSATPGYFRTLGIPLLRGRLFDSRDTHDSASVAIVSDIMARQFWPGEDPIGQRFTYERVTDASRAARTVIGIVGDTKHLSLAAEAPPTFYTPQSQDPSYHAMTLAVRASGDPTMLTAAIRSQVDALDPGLPLYGVQRLDTLVIASMAAQRFRTWLLGLFAALALVLAAIGVYGVISLVVSQRTQEMGIRLALGATRLGVLRLVLTEGMRPVVLGLVLGLGGALALGRVLETMLHGVTPADPLTFGAVAVGLSAVAVLACYVPARRVTRIDPVAALRAE